MVCVCVAALPASPHIYLALLHGVAEERVQQQVLQIAVAVERLFDFSQEDTVGGGGGGDFTTRSSNEWSECDASEVVARGACQYIGVIVS